MTKKKKHKPELEVDFYLNEQEDEIVIAVRTTDGTQLTPQDILDAAVHSSLEAFGAIAEPITAQDIKDNNDLN